MNTEIHERRERLERLSNVAYIEAQVLLLIEGETKSFRIKDIQAYQRLRTRLCRLKEATGRRFTVKMCGNRVRISRIENRTDR